jgi:hypothetical protein
MASQCQATNQAGKPCSAQHWRDGWCRWHHPDLAEERRIWSAKGGAGCSNRNRAKKQLPDEPMTTEELQAYLTLTFKATLSGKLAPNIANALGNLARSMAEIRKTSELETRLSELEQAAGISDRRIG